QSRDYDRNMEAYSSDVTQDGQWTAIGGNSYDPILLIDLHSGEVAEMAGTFGSVLDMVFNPDGTLLATPAARDEQDTYVALWDVKTRTLRHELHSTEGGGYF